MEMTFCYRLEYNVDTRCLLLYLYCHHAIACGRCSIKMVSVLDSESSGPGSSPGRGTALCSWTRHFTLIMPLFNHVNKWVLTKLMLGGNLA